MSAAPDEWRSVTSAPRYSPSSPGRRARLEPMQDIRLRRSGSALNGSGKERRSAECVVLGCLGLGPSLVLRSWPPRDAHRGQRTTDRPKTRNQVLRTTVELKSGLDAGEPDQLTALRTRVHHAQIADERDEPAGAMIRARRTYRRGSRIDRRDAQQPAGVRARNRRRAGVVPRHARLRRRRPCASGTDR